MKLHNQSQEVLQEFRFYTEDKWEQAKDNYDATIQRQFEAQKKTFFVGTEGDFTFYLIGLGAPEEFASVQPIATAFAQQYKTAFLSSNTKMSGIDNIELLKNIMLGLYMGTYEYQPTEIHPFLNTEMSWQVEGFESQELERLSQEVMAIHEGENFAMDWLNHPANLKPPSQLLKALQEKGKKHGFTIKTLDKAACEKEGLGAFLSVNQASKEAAFTIVEYRHSEAKNHIGWVGKCVLFDTGGISIKGSQNMHYMKSDMGGACAVMGALIAISAQKIPVNITAILPMTDNIISQDAYLPGDVVKAYNGKTIEVLNTDAEGRLTLADGLAYLVKNYQVDSLIDLATLTGSAVRMFGYTAAALFSNGQETLNSIESVSQKTQQRVWNMPLWEEWKEEIQSDVADYKNISSKPFGDCIVAATFLKEFIGDHPQWAHLDIAGVAFGNVGYAKDKAATGYGVQLLNAYIEDQIKT